MADTPIASCPDEAESPMIAQRDSSAVSVQSVSGASPPELADSFVDSLSMFESELPGCDDMAVVPSQPLADIVTVGTAGPPASVSMQNQFLEERQTAHHASGWQSDREAAETLRYQEAELVHTTLQRLCSDIEARLVRTEEAIHQLCDVAAGTPLHRLCAGIDGRLARTEEALEKTVEHTVELGGHIDARFARKTIAANNELRELCANIDKRLSRTEEALRRTESLVGDRTVQQLSARIDVRVAETEDAMRRIERSVESAQLHHLAARIDGHFAQAEERLRRLEALLEAGATPAAGSNHVLVENNRTIDDRSVSAASAVAVQRFVAEIRFAVTQTVARARLSVRRRGAITATSGALGAVQRAARRCAPAVVLFVAVAVVVGFRSDASIDTAPPLPVEPLGKRGVGPGPLTLPMIEALTAPPAAPVRQANAGTGLAARPLRQAPIAEQPARTSEFLGSLSIASEPPGASVFINGGLVGVTPLELTDRRAGSLALQITREGFERWTAAIQVPAGRLTQVRATLRPSAP